MPGRTRMALLLALAVGMLPACWLGTGKAAPSPKAKGNNPGPLRIAIQPPTTFDPALRSDPSDQLIAEQVFEPLVAIDPQSQQLLPAVASSWDVLDGGARFVFHLRPDARFQNGVTVTAADVAFELNRVAAKATNSGLAYLLQPVLGYSAVHDAATATALDGVLVQDDRTLQISLSSPWVDFPRLLADPALAPIPATAYQSDPGGFMARPVGSGPYAFVTGTSLQGPITLDRSASYWGPAPSIATIQFVVDVSQNATVGALRAGRVDIGEVPPAMWSSALRRFGSRGYTPVAAGLYLGFNLKAPSLGDLRLREAISLAIDRQAIASQVYDGVMEPATGLVPDGLPGHNAFACVALCLQNLPQARSLVKDAGGGATLTVSFDYPTGGPDDAVASTIATDLGAIGVSVTLQPHSAQDFLTTLQNNNQAMFLQVWVADYPSADWFLTPLFETGSLDNHSGYTADATDQLLAGARQASQQSQELGDYSRAEGAVLADMAMSPIGFFRNHYAATARVQGFYVDLVGGFQVARMSLAA